jgi:outer membrane protein assembly factor BamB
MVETADMACNLPVSANPLGDFLKDVWDFLKDAKHVYIDDFDVSSSVEQVQPFKRFGWLDPTVAIAEKPGFATHERPVVVTASMPCELRAFRWNPPNLEPLWTEEHKIILTSSPAVLNGGSLVVVGRLDGKVVGYDLVTGRKLWVHDAKEAVMGTPASLGGLVYVASLRHIHALEPATGDEVFSSELRGETLASVAMSGSHVYVSSAQPTYESDMITSGKELESFSFDFQKRGHDPEGGGGLASPAVASNGTVYAVATEGDRAFLRAYPAP